MGTCSWKNEHGNLGNSINPSNFSQYGSSGPNHYARETRSGIPCRTLDSVTLDLSPEVHNHRNISKYSFLTRMPTSGGPIPDSRLGGSQLTTAIPIPTTHDHDWSGTLNKHPRSETSRYAADFWSGLWWRQWGRRGDEQLGVSRAQRRSGYPTRTGY